MPLIVDGTQDAAAARLLESVRGRLASPTTTLTANHVASFKMNSLISREYETVPLRAGHIPGCTVFVPGGAAGVIGQRRAAATLHTEQLRPLTAATKGAWTDMALLDLRPEQRSMNKTYLYAENLRSNFMRFPSKREFDHRRL